MKKHILIVNQHGDNRGDEAALLAMMGAFEERLPGVTFSLVHQFRDPHLPIDYGPHRVSAMSMRLPLRDYLGLASACVLRRLGLSPRFSRLLVRPSTRALLDAYQRADLVVSAPGGPYFGDIYADHELAHWLFVMLARAYRRPVFLYATSAGPFEKKLLNLLRRRLFSLFDDLCVREVRSAKMLRDLLGRDIEVTADSALQRRVPPIDRERYFTGDRAQLAERFLVAVTAIKHNFPGVDDGERRQARYEQVLLEAITHLQARRDCHFLVLPQLYGAAKSDVPYLRSLAERFAPGTSWELVDPTADSDTQRGVVGMCDLSIACRYHPQIFASSGVTPGICIYYEHKAYSHVESLGLSEQAFDIFALDETAAVLAALDRAVDDGESIARRIRERLPQLVERSRRTTEKACALIDGGAVDAHGHERKKR